MKNIIFSTILFFAFLATGWSQNANVEKKGIPYKVWISKMDSKQILKGYLYKLSEDSITLVRSLVADRFQYNYQTIEIENVKTIKLRKKGKIIKGLIAGGLTGFSVGGLIGLFSGDDEPGFVSFKAEQKAIFLGTTVAISGMIIGGGIAESKRIKIPINGSKSIYKEELTKLKTFLVKMK